MNINTNSHHPKEDKFSELIQKLGESSQTFPVIIFSHGLTGAPEIYYSFGEQAASHGFIVFSAYHTDKSSFFDYPSPAEISYKSRPPEMKEWGPEEKVWRENQLKRRVEDVKQLLNTFTQPEILEKYPSLSGLHHLMDLSRVSIVGHSFGGGTALAAVVTDPRIKGGISWDGWFFPCWEDLGALKTKETKDDAKDESEIKFELDVDDEDLKKLKEKFFISLDSELWQWEKNRTNRLRVLDRVPLRARDIEIIKGSSHQNFTDMSLLMPTIGRWIGVLSKQRDPHECLDEITTRTITVLKSNL